MRERDARRQWENPTANEAIVNADISILDQKIAEIQARLSANGSRARNKTLRNLMRERRRIIHGNGRY